jgi:hypothetical protein
VATEKQHLLRDITRYSDQILAFKLSKMFEYYCVGKQLEIQEINEIASKQFSSWSE